LTIEAIMNTRFNKLWGCLLVAGLLFSALPSCTAQKAIKIGFVAGLTGPNAALGVDGRDGALLAVNKINSAGGVDGHPIELVVRDNLETAKGSIAAVNELIADEGVFTIIGHVTSSMMLAAWEETKDSGVIYLSPTASTSQLSGLDDNFLRVTPTTTIFAEDLAEYAADDLGLKKIAIFYDTDNAAFTDIYREGFTNKINSSGGEIVWTYDFSSASAPDFKPALADLKSVQPDGILIIASASDTALIAQQIRLCNCESQLLTSNWALTKDLIENGGTAVDGIVAVATYNENNQSREYLDFATHFHERFGREPSFSAGSGYEAMLILADALKKSNGEKEGLKQALLETRDFVGVFGNISLDEYGDVKRTLYLVAIQNGEFSTLKTLTTP